MKEEFAPSRYRLIYVFRINDAAHAGCLKIGETSISDLGGVNPFTIQPQSHILEECACRRIEQYTKTAGIDFELLYTETAFQANARGVVAFNDKEVHQILLRSGVKKKVFTGAYSQGKEWFVTDLETAKKAVKAAKEGRSALTPSEITTDLSPIVFRPEQREAIDKTLKRYKLGQKMLWNAKMRFGKTLSALQVIKEMGFAHTLILTHRPVVDSGWYEDFSKIFYDCPQYRYGSKARGESFSSPVELAQKSGGKFVYFASIQDLRGSSIVSGKFDKNEEMFAFPWDFVIVDEAHEGTQTDLGKSVIDAVVKPQTKVLQLSGTPFNLLDNFKEDEIYTWDYVMEQRAKATWDVEHFGDPNPYACLPKMHIFTYNLGKLFSKYADESIAFNFREFFKTGEDGEFIHRGDVQSFLNLLVKPDLGSRYPFANDEYRKIFRHTLWVVPGVKEARALSALLKKHEVFQIFDIVNVAGDGDSDEKSRDALEKVEKAIGDNPDETYTITLSCGRLTTGVSVKAWTGVLMLAGSYNTAASAYMQTIFRVQTPATINGRMKEDCYVFDFAPDRTLQILSTVPRISTKPGKATEHERKKLGDFLNYCPVIAMEGSKMETLDVSRMLQQLKKAYVERVVRSGFEDVNLYNDELLKLTDVDIKEFEKLKGIIGQTKAIGSPGNIEINSQGMTEEEYAEEEHLERKKKELSEEEKARLKELKKKKKVKEEAISILRGISIRMPLLIYGADIKNEDTELTIDNFTSLVDPQSWDEFMPRGVTKQRFNQFKKYYDPEVFSAAGKRIRAMARSADRLFIEERIKRLADIFATFRNPDKETVLTPWRVVNLHMGETLGGYCFYNEDYSEPIEEPRYIDQGEITAEVFSPGSHLLEINSKSGLYPLYLAYNMYRKHLAELTPVPSTLEEHLHIWDKVVEENVFVICKTPMAKAITRRTLMGFRTGRVNTRFFENLINQIINKPKSFAERVLNGREFWKSKSSSKMKFKAIVGNPPYQEVVAQKATSNGQKASKSIFQHFQVMGEQLGRFTSFIYPGARWIHRSGKGLEQFGVAQMNDLHLSKLLFFPDSNEIFNEVAIADGLSIVVKDMVKTQPGFRYIYSQNGKNISVNAEAPGEELFALNPRNWSIVRQLEQAISKFGCLHPAILPRCLFSIESDFVEKNPALVREYHDGDIFNKNTEIKLFTNDKSGKSGRARWYVASRDVIKTGKEYLDKWKVVVSSANAGGQKRDNQIAVLDNYSAFGRSRVALKTFQTEKEARNFFRYAQSEIIRFAFLLTDESLTSLAKKVPDLSDYSDNNGLIDYDQDVNAQLYKLFRINEESQKYIRTYLVAR